jgi:antitoxin PrlF
MSESTITAKGQTTVPADVRLAIGAAPGTRLVWHTLTDGRLFVRVKNKSMLDLKGMLKPTKGRRVAPKDMKPCTSAAPWTPTFWHACWFKTMTHKPMPPPSSWSAIGQWAKLW